MPAEIYLIGIDLIIDENKQIKVLELQNIYESNNARAYQLTLRNPVQHLKESIKKTLPDLKMEEPDSNNTDELARKASHAGSENTIPNRGIEALLRMKWLFYSICNETPQLKKYIPNTIVATLKTLDSVFPISEQNDKLFLFKPAEFACGNGIVLLPQKMKTQNELKSFVENQSCLEEKTLPELKWHRPFLIQEYLYDESSSGPVSRPVIRVYAALVWDTSKEKPKLSIAIDVLSAYRHIRKQQKPDDFTLANNIHERCDITGIKSQITIFLRDFFRYILLEQRKVSYKYWEISLKRYIENSGVLDSQQRLLLISKIAMAMMMEQRFTENRLSYYQCFLLERFIEIYKDRDAVESNLNRMEKCLTNAMKVIIKQNLLSYVKDENYYLHKVVRNYFGILPESEIEAENKFKIAVMNKFKDVKRVESGGGKASIFDYAKGMKRRVSFFDYCNHEEIDAFSAVSKGSLGVVAGYARRGW